METFTGTIDKIIFQNQDNGYSVTRFLPEEKSRDAFVVVGYLQGVQKGETVRVTGNWKNHPRFGTQLQAEKCETVQPTTHEGIVQYLGGGVIPGVGYGMAERIVEKFGEKTLEIMDGDLDRLREVNGIGKKKLDAIRGVWEDLKGSREVFLFLQENGVSPAMAQKIYKHYGQETMMLLKENPYRLAEDIWGIGFVKADTVSQKMGHKPDSHFRIRAGLRHILNKALEDGHVFLLRDDLLTAASNLLEVDYHQIVYTLDDELNLKELVCDDDKIYLPRMYLYEERLAAALNRIRNQKQAGPSRECIETCVREFESFRGFAYHSIQREAVVRSASEKIMIITGGPGTGKTTTLLGILRIARKYEKKVLLAAPTGRAAKRMEEVTGHKAKTIHRLLEYQPLTGFMRDQDRPLECDLVVIDEVSMVDLPLMYALICAMPSHASMLFIGDEDQLPPVGPGQVLKDMIQSGGITLERLTEIFRQAQQSRIVTSAHMIRAGRMPSLENQEGADFTFVEENDPIAAAEAVCELCTKRLPDTYGFDRLRDIQVLTPMHRGQCGAINLNHILQAEIQGQKREPGQEHRRRIFSGDKVMQTRNNYDKQVFNGDIGYVQTVDLRSGKISVRYDTVWTEYERHEMDELLPAYAITIHKSQGNEYPAVVLPLLTQHYIMLYRNLLYTGVTRAKKRLVIVGSKKALAMAVHNTDPHRRNTYLAARINPAANRSH